MDADYDVFQKYILAILDAIGNAIDWAAPYDEERNIEVVKKFIEHALGSNIVVEAEQEGLIDQKEEDDIDFGI